MRRRNCAEHFAGIGIWFSFSVTNPDSAEADCCEEDAVEGMDSADVDSTLDPVGGVFLPALWLLCVGLRCFSSDKVRSLVLSITEANDDMTAFFVFCNTSKARSEVEDAAEAAAALAECFTALPLLEGEGDFPFEVDTEEEEAADDMFVLLLLGFVSGRLRR